MTQRPYHRPAWTTKPAVVIASGPSLADDQLQAVEQAHREHRVHVVAVNNTAERAPWADVVYMGDFTCLRHYHPRLAKLCGGEWVTQCRAGAERWKLTHVKPCSNKGMTLERIHMNGNSGAQAICVAAMFGARRILLIGFDMKLGADGRAHWFGQHPGNLVTRQLFEEWIHKTGAIARDAKSAAVEIVNCTPDSALDCFKRSTIEAELA